MLPGTHLGQRVENRRPEALVRGRVAARGEHLQPNVGWHPTQCRGTYMSHPPVAILAAATLVSRNVRNRHHVVGPLTELILQISREGRVRHQLRERLQTVLTRSSARPVDIPGPGSSACI